MWSGNYILNLIMNHIFHDIVHFVLNHDLASFVRRPFGILHSSFVIGHLPSISS